MNVSTKISVIGAGLAGCEAAYQLATHGFTVDLYEMKPHQFTPAHHYAGFAELVCSNSLKASRLGSASGLLKAEMRLLGSLVLESAEQSAVPAGGALAVDRTLFSDYITAKIMRMPNIHLHEGEMTTIPDGSVIIAAGPLATKGLSDAIATLVGEQSLSFYDAAAPIVAGDSLDRDIVFSASRYGREEPLLSPTGEASPSLEGEGDYLNCPMDKEEYHAFYEALLSAETAPLHQIDKQGQRVYEGCMPVEVMAKRGIDTLRFGPMKPVGLTDPRTGRRPYAVVQLRKENLSSSMYNLVGFQTNLKWGEQQRVFSMIPGLANADFLRFGVMHRNTFLNSPRLLSASFALKQEPRIFFAGQITGVEGYVESAMSGILAGHHLMRHLTGRSPLTLPPDCMMGALSRYISDETVAKFQPMGANMGLLPPLSQREKNKARRYELLAERAIASLKEQLQRGGV